MTHRSPTARRRAQAKAVDLRPVLAGWMFAGLMIGLVLLLR